VAVSSDSFAFFLLDELLDHLDALELLEDGHQLGFV
jgi:hypothetical protein